MANNRMWLCYRPSRRIYPIAKRMAYGWYPNGVPTAEGLQAFLDDCIKYAADHQVSQDDFILLQEEGDNSWRYAPHGPDGAIKVEFKSD